MANLIVAQLLYLDSADPHKDVTLYVNSPGGSVTAGGCCPRAGHVRHAGEGSERALAAPCGMEHPAASCLLRLPQLAMLNAAAAVR